MQEERRSKRGQAVEEKAGLMKLQKTIDRIKAFHDAVVTAATETVPETIAGKTDVPFC